MDINSFFNSAISGDLEAVKEALDSGTDVNARRENGDTALICAVQNDRVDVVRELIDRGADVNATRQDGLSALMVASFFGLSQIVELLLENGAEINQKDRLGLTARGWAEARDFREVIDVLELYESAINSKEVEEETKPAGKILVGMKRAWSDIETHRQSLAYILIILGLVSSLLIYFNNRKRETVNLTKAQPVRNYLEITPAVAAQPQVLEPVEKKVVKASPVKRAKKKILYRRSPRKRYFVSPKPEFIEVARTQTVPIAEPTAPLITAAKESRIATSEPSLVQSSPAKKRKRNWFKAVPKAIYKGSKRLFTSVVMPD
jgi:hypothetical protein